MRCSPRNEAPWLNSCGTVNCGGETVTTAWASMSHVFSVRNDGHKDPTGTGPLECTGPQTQKDILSQHPVDLLVTERGHIQRPRRTPQMEDWEEVMSSTPSALRPKVVLESWCSHASMWDNGPTGKGARVRWEKLGHDSRFRRVCSSDIGGAVEQKRLIVARVKKKVACRWTWDRMTPCTQARPMSNLLTPPGLTRMQQNEVAPLGSLIADDSTDPMPARLGAWTRTEKGVRRLCREELGRGLGIDQAKMCPEKAIDPSNTTCAFTWEHVGKSFVLESEEEEWPALRMETAPNSSPDRPTSKGDHKPFNWVLPDLSVGGDWCQDRVASLHRAVATQSQDQRADFLTGGLLALDRHRDNCDEQGPDLHHLQTLWWEFPPEHWDALRKGSRMNFLLAPEAHLHPNSPMDADQLKTAVQFVNELLDIDALGHPPPTRDILATTPLFCVPKPGQPGQWRVIANMKDGGQNLAVGADPVCLPRVSHTLDQMHSGSHTAVVDASKFFHQFRTHPDGRPYLGLTHPTTEELLEWIGSPMGGANSPALGGRHGLAFLRLLRETHSDKFGTVPKANCWWREFIIKDACNPKLGHGLVLVQKDNLPGVEVWVFVDDFLVHGPTHEATADALMAFFDAAIKVGLLCHPLKCHPPSQEAMCCGFLFDAISTPTLRIPVAKWERGHVMTEHLLAQGPDWEHSRLALATVAGTLESLAEGTPLRLGHTHLRHFHSLIRPPGLGSGLAPYLTRTRLTPAVIRDLRWWDTFLRSGGGQTAQSERSAALVPSWGDGSGTGTGGTLGPPGQPLAMWMGQWSPVVHAFSSNWKELKTLLLALRHLRALSTARGTTIFHFTNDSATHWTAASGTSSSLGLHALIEEMCLIELELECSLQVVHAPGLVMMQQGTDGLSQGVWATALHGLMDQAEITALVFAPLVPDLTLAQSLVDFAGQTSWRCQPWESVWDARECLHTCSVWFPPPEVARQALNFMLETRVESPLTASAILVIPRVVPAFSHGLSRHTVESPAICPLTPWLPLAAPPVLPIPIVTLCMPTHIRSLSAAIPHRVELPPAPRAIRWHWQQAEQMRGVPQRSFN